ncbi:hypothetical protein V6N13_029236 [Hibiscus sabdariffa]|uniref:Translation elongation factor EF1B beta/delta subunit guanine nucleotide exchange domain-containing protein n=1 Tax=Hibiscus sabdariffa TaxID=183260 RepID=A0ABR2TBD0_9ROSI
MNYGPINTTTSKTLILPNYHSETPSSRATAAPLSISFRNKLINGCHFQRSRYISGYQASKDDVTVYAALSGAPSASYVNASRWYNHIDALLRISGVSGEGSGVTVEGFAPAEAVATPPAADSKAAVDEDDEDDDVDLFGEETEEEKKAAEERAAAIKASGKKKESGKSSVLLDIKPWDDETDMKKLEEAVRAVQMEGLLWGASKLVPVGYGIKKLQIMMTIVDDLVVVTLSHSTRFNEMQLE